MSPAATYLKHVIGESRDGTIELVQHRHGNVIHNQFYVWRQGHVNEQSWKLAGLTDVTQQVCAVCGYRMDATQSVTLGNYDDTSVGYRLSDALGQIVRVRKSH